MEDLNNNGENSNNYNVGNALNNNGGNAFNNSMGGTLNNDVGSNIGNAINNPGVNNFNNVNAINIPVGNSFNNEGNAFNNPAVNAFNNNMGNNFNIANGNNNDELAAFNSPNTNNTNNNGSKGAKKILLIAIILLLIVIVVAGIIVFLHAKDSNQEVENEVDTTYEENTAEETIDSYMVVTDLSKLPKDNPISKKIEEFNSLKISKVTGTFEGVFNLNYEDIYKISVDTNDMLMFNSSEEDKATFYIADMEDTMCPLSFELIYDKEDEFEELTTESEEKGTIYEYNKWKYYMLDESAVLYYAFNRSEDDDAVLSLNLDAEVISEMSEKEFKDISEMIIDCVDIKHIGKYDADKLEEADSVENTCTNVLAPADMNKVVISDTISLDLSSHFKVRGISNRVNSYSDQFITNSLTASREGKTYLLTVDETKGESIEDIKDKMKGYDFTIEDCDLYGIQAYVAYDKNKVFKELFFSVGDITYRIGYDKGTISNAREFDESTLQYENVIQAFGDGLFLAPEN